MAGRVDDRTDAWNGGICSDGEVGKNVAKAAGRAELHIAMVDAAAHREIVLVTEQLIVVGGLQRDADSRRIGARTVDGAVRHKRASNAAGRAGDRLGELVENLKTGRRRPWARKRIVLQAERVDKRIAGRSAATLDIGFIAIDMALLEAAH